MMRVYGKMGALLLVSFLLCACGKNNSENITSAGTIAEPSEPKKKKYKNPMILVEELSPDKIIINTKRRYEEYKSFSNQDSDISLISYAFFKSVKNQHLGADLITRYDNFSAIVDCFFTGEKFVDEVSESLEKCLDIAEATR